MDTPFIQALSKCLQSFCNGHVQYDKDVRILGHLYVSVDSKDNNYFLNENLCRSNESHVSVLSKSFAVPPVAFSDGNNIQAQNVNQQSLQQPQFNAQNPLQDVNQQSLQNSLISQDDMSNNLVGFKEANLQLEEVSDITFNSELKPEMFGDRVLNSGVVFSPKDNRGKRRKTSNPMRSDGGGGGMSSLCCCDDIKDSFDLSGSRLKCPVHQMKMEPDIIGFDEDDDYNDDGGQDSEMDTHKRDQLQIGRVWSMSEDSSAAGASDSSYSATKKSKKAKHRRRPMNMNHLKKVWTHFKKSRDGSEVICLLCKTVLLYRGSTLIMLRHIRDKHSTQYEGDGKKQHRGRKSEDFNNRADKYRKQSKPSQVWDHFVKNDDGSDYVTCLLCSQVMSYKDSTSGMLRHIRMKHSTHFREDLKGHGMSRPIKQEDFSDGKGTVDYSRFFESDEELDGFKEESKAGKAKELKRRKSQGWRYFEKSEDGKFVVCLLCKELFSFSSSTSGMLKHIKAKHPETWEEDFSFNSSGTSKERTLGEKILDTSRKASFKTEQGKQAKLLNKMKIKQERSHEDVTDRKPQIRRQFKEKSQVWNYFDKVEDGKFVVCLICEKLLTFNSSTSGMLRHMKVKHANAIEEDEQRMKGNQPQFDEETTQLISQVISQELTNKSEVVQDMF